MKQAINKKGRALKAMFFLMIIAGSFGSFAQRRSEIVDLKLTNIELTDLSGNPVDVNSLYLEQVVKIKLAVKSISHGQDIPVGACKLKIGFGSKLVLDPQFNMNDADASRYFKWSSSSTDGQTMVTGELVAALPSTMQEISLLMKLKGDKPGTSTITANFLITNHNTNTVVSDEDGSNNSASMRYTVIDKVMPVDDNAVLELGIYPNPVTEAHLNIVATSGKFKGKYRFVMVDATGKLIQTKDQQLDGLKNVKYNVGHIAAGKYLIQVYDINKAQTHSLRFEKL